MNTNTETTNDDQPLTAAIPWDEFAKADLSSETFVKLIFVCDGQLAEATILWDLLSFHKTRGLDVFRKMSSTDYHDQYGTEIGTDRSIQRSIRTLTVDDLIEQAQVVRNMPRKFRLNWVALSHRLVAVNNKLPGLSRA
ncbi:hypothetical protein [Limnohabitans sp.]|uniref:hypothetical protein n=1 Tax=Limnohabitans sp. TaxID=1907725 RepID=UPI00286F6C1A|nr:hypothetical protein [Limnohabitans sp.]